MPTIPRMYRAIAMKYKILKRFDLYFAYNHAPNATPTSIAMLESRLQMLCNVPAHAIDTPMRFNNAMMKPMSPVTPDKIKPQYAQNLRIS